MSSQLGSRSEECVIRSRVLQTQQARGQDEAGSLSAHRSIVSSSPLVLPFSSTPVPFLHRVPPPPSLLKTNSLVFDFRNLIKNQKSEDCVTRADNLTSGQLCPPSVYLVTWCCAERYTSPRIPFPSQNNLIFFFVTVMVAEVVYGWYCRFSYNEVFFKKLETHTHSQTHCARAASHLSFFLFSPFFLLLSLFLSHFGWPHTWAVFTADTTATCVALQGATPTVI